MFKSVQNVLEWAASRRDDPRDPLAVGERLLQAIRDEDHTISSLLGRPVPVDERIANMRRLVDQRGEGWRALHARSINSQLSGSYEARRSDGAYRYMRPRLFELTEVDRQDVLSLLCGLVPDEVKRGLEQVVRSDVDPGAVPRDDRERLLGQAFDRRRQLVAEYRALRQAAAALEPPVELPSLSDGTEPRLATLADAERRQEAVGSA